MAWSYLGPTTPAGKVRLLIGDTEATDPQLQDEEIAWLLTESGGNVYRTAVVACETLAAKYARQTDRAVSGAGGLSVSGSQKAQQYRELAATIEVRARKARRVGAFAGGISEAQKDATAADADRVPPAFTNDRELGEPEPASEEGE